MAISLSKQRVRARLIPANRPSGRAQALVLVVDDDDDTRFLLKTMLELLGLCVVEACDGERAVQLAESARPNLILMDATLPRLDGIAATRRIRESPALRDVPVVFLSAHAQSSFRDAALAAGGNEYLSKPFALGQLEGALVRCLGKGVVQRV
jgi:CheY-like chemotaxis protein